MGIKNLHPFLRKICPNIYQQHHLSEYRFKKIAIDLSIYLCKFKTIYGEKWLEALFRLICILRKWNIHMVFVFDSKAPPEKDREKEERRQARKKNEERVVKLESIWMEERINYMRDDSKIEIASIKDEQLRNILQKKKNNWTRYDIDVEVDRLRKTIFSITTQDIELTKQLFEICCIPYMLAIGEAEATCSILSRQGHVYGVLTEDTDVLAYGCPNMLLKLDFEEETVFEICLEKVLNQIEMDENQFLDFCIMCGTDYNQNLFRIGPDKAFKLLKKYKNLDELLKYKGNEIPIESLNHKRVKEIFQKVNISLEKPIQYCGIPEYKNLQMFCFHNNIAYDNKTIEEIFSRKDIIFH